MAGTDEATAPETVKAEPAHTVTAMGRLEPDSEIIDVSAPAGSRIDRLAVKQGDYVEQGAPLAYLDSSAEMTAARDYAKAQWESAKKLWEAETALGRAAIDEARLHLKQSEEVALLAIQAQEAAVRRSRAELEKARLDHGRSNRMLEDKAIPRSQYDSAALALRQAEAKLDHDRLTLAQLKRDREIKLELVQAEIKSAVASLARAQVASRVGPLAENLKLAQAQLDRTVIRAPIAGEIIQILTRAGESLGRDPILKMGNTRLMYAVGEVYETDVRHVRLGQRATITSRAFPDTKITGRVDRISKLVHKNDVLGIDPTSDADARVVEVRIRLDDSRIAAGYNQLQIDVSIAVDSP